MGKNNPELLAKIIQAWSRVQKKGVEFRIKNAVAREPYTQWVLERVRIIKLPFDIDPTYVADIPDPPPMLVEEIEVLKMPSRSKR